MISNIDSNRRSSIPSPLRQNSSVVSRQSLGFPPAGSVGTSKHWGSCLRPQGRFTDLPPVIATRYGGLPQQTRWRLLRRLGLPGEVPLRGHHGGLLQPEADQNTRPHPAVHRRAVSHHSPSEVGGWRGRTSSVVSDHLCVVRPRRLNNNEFAVLEATGIFKKLPQLRKM